jgi:hypothetical protein
MIPEHVIANFPLLETAREFGWRLDAPFHFRLIVQPLVALLLGFRDGRLDAKVGTPPYLYDLVFRTADRRGLLQQALDSIWKPLLVGIILDAIVQFTFLDSVSIPGALLIGGLLVGVPYVLARGGANRLASRRWSDKSASSPA